MYIVDTNNITKHYMERKYYKAIIETVLTLVNDWSSDNIDWLISELQDLSTSKFDKELEEL